MRRRVSAPRAARRIVTCNFRRARLAAALFSAVLPAWADSALRLPMTARGAPRGMGRCDIRLQVDGEVEATVRWGLLSLHTLSGDGARDDGSECDRPLPERLEGFRFEAKESRNAIRLAAAPSESNGWGAVVRIRNSAGGFGRYQFQFVWKSADEDARTNPSWNNAEHLDGAGRGQLQTGDSAAQALGAVSVDIDRGGRIQVSFRTAGRSLLFAGTLMSNEGDALKADVASEDGRLRGPLYLSFDSRRRVARITLEATDGRERLHLTWERR